MASPVDSARVGTNITGATTTHAINVGSPVAGTFLVVFIRFAVAGITVTNFTNYEQLFTSAADASSDVTYVFYRVADGSEGATDTFTTSGSTKSAALAWEITGASATVVPDFSAVATGTTAANSANPNAASVTGGPEDVLYLAIMGLDGEGNAPSASPTNYSAITTANSGTGGLPATNCSVGGGSRQITNSSSDDPGAFTHAAATTGWSAWTIAIHPTDPPATIERSASFDATGTIATSGQFFSVFERSASLNATAAIDTSGIFWTTFERQVALAATADISVSGAVSSIVERSASFDATATIEASGGVDTPTMSSDEILVPFASINMTA